MGILKGLKYDLHILLAMSFGIKEGIDEVNANLNPIISHLIKIAIIDENRDIYIKGWQKEILAWLGRIYKKCNNLKGGSSLKLKDYKLCLDDDLGRNSLIEAHIIDIELSWGENEPKERSYNVGKLRNSIYELLEAQFKAMSNEKWSKDTLLNHPIYQKFIQ